jgi:hypothetical protein
MSWIKLRIRSLLAQCHHDGPCTHVRSFRGGDIWRCELCGGQLVLADEFDASL